MDTRNNSVALENITSRDVTDTQVRGICKAAALLFGLAYELWAKMPLESGYAAEEKPQGQPLSGVWESCSPELQAELTGVSVTCTEYFESGDITGLVDYLERKNYDSDTKAALWTQLNSKIRAAIKKETQSRKELA
jgi:hypothetical protein